MIGGMVAVCEVEMVEDMGVLIVVVVMVVAGGVEVVDDNEVVMVAADRVEEVWDCFWGSGGGLTLDLVR